MPCAAIRTEDHGIDAIQDLHRYLPRAASSKTAKAMAHRQRELAIPRWTAGQASAHIANSEITHAIRSLIASR
jgi:hypothetical protein